MRSGFPWFLFGLILLMDVTVWLLEKAAALHAGPIGAQYYRNLVSQLWIWSALLLAPLQLVVWLKILRRVDLSVAYPLSSIGYPLGLAAAVVVFDEQLSMLVWIGAFFITAGVALLGSERERTAVAPFREASTPARHGMSEEGEKEGREKEEQRASEESIATGDDAQRMGVVAGGLRSEAGPEAPHGDLTARSQPYAGE